MDNFLNACGATESLRLEIEGPRPGRVRQRMLLHPFALVGRASTSDIALRHAQVSLRHAYLQLVNGRLACFDLGGRGGIQWADGRPARAGWIDPGQTIGIGPFGLRRHSALNTQHSTLSTQHSALNTSPLNLRWDGGGPDIVLDFPDQGSGNLSRWRMSRVVTLVGRAPGCRIRLPDVNVSWHHCSLVRTHEGLWVVDLMSRVGVLVNGTPQRYGRLDDGDELHVGPFRIVVRMVEKGSYRVAASRTHHATPIPSNAPAVLQASPVDMALSIPDTRAQDALETELVELLTSQRGSPALVLLVEQFGRMQQQMLEQFNQSLMMLMQHMGEQYREQMRQVREEMEALRLLSEELIAMKERVRGDAPALPGRDAIALQLPKPAAAAPPPAPVANGHKPEPVSAPREAAAAASEKLKPPAPTPVEDPLVMVSRRISQIRGEQRGRWQKIMDLVRAR